MRTYAMPGLETDNLLGFLALLGLLRALEHERPTWFPRAYFDGVPLQAQLSLMEEVSQGDIAAAASAGCTTYAQHFDFSGFGDLIFDGATARMLMRESLRDTIFASIMSAMCSDIAVRPAISGTKERIDPTPLCAMFGQGHQSFLDRLRTVSSGTLPRALQIRRNATEMNLNDPTIIARALFAPWTRSDSQPESGSSDHGPLFGRENDCCIEIRPGRLERFAWRRAGRRSGRCQS